MAKKVKFPLEMADGVQARTLEALKESFDVEKVVGYFLDGKLRTWLEDRYYEDEAEAVAALSAEDSQLGKKLSEIFGVEYAEAETVDVEEITWRNERLAKLKQLTDDDEIIKNIDSVAFNQEELADLYEEGVEKIYLGEGEFTIPKSKQDLEYIEFAGARVKGRKPKAKEPETVHNKLELELRKRNPGALKWMTFSETDLFIKDTNEKINDDNENVKNYFVLPDNRTVYCAGVDVVDVDEEDEYDSHNEDCIFVKTVEGDKTLITSANEDDDEYLSLIFADGDKIIWERDGEGYYSYYFADGKKIHFYEADDYSDNRIVTVYKDTMFVIIENTSVDKKLYTINIKTGVKQPIQIYDNESADETFVSYARYAEGRIYIASSRPPDEDGYSLAGTGAFHCMDMEGNIIHSFIKEELSDIREFVVKNNKIYGMHYAWDPTLYMIDLNDDTVSHVIDTGRESYGTLYIKEEDGYIHYAFGRHGDDPKTVHGYKIKCDGTGKTQKSDITFTKEDRTDYYLE